MARSSPSHKGKPKQPWRKFTFPHGSGGMTLVETIVALALLSLGLLILATGFSTAANMFRDGTDIKNAGQYAAGVLEGAPDAGGNTVQNDISGGITFQIGSESFSAAGDYRNVEDTKNSDISFYVFDSQAYQAEGGSE